MAGPRAKPRIPAPLPDEADPFAAFAVEERGASRRWSEPGLVLHELDALTEELLPRRSPRETADAAAPAVADPDPLLALDSLDLPPDAPSPPAVAPAPVHAQPLEEMPAAPAGFPSTLYLEERLRLANVALSGFGQGIRDLDQRWATLRQTADTLQQEIQRAQREVEFVRASGATADPSGSPEPAPPAIAPSPTPTPLAPPPVWPTGRVPPPQRRVEGRPLPGPFGAFTAQRYNQTIGDLKARRLKLAKYTAVFAVLISVGLLILTAIAKEPAPPLWIGVLPAVWMIPVPFFVASFWGTQRVLRRNHLELAAD